MRKLVSGKARQIVVAAAGMVVAVAVAAPAGASHDWNGYHWARTSNPFTVKLGDNVSSSWDGYLQAISADWSRDHADPTWLDATPPPASEFIGPSPLNTSVVAGGTSGRKCRSSSLRVEVCNASYGNNGWLGLATIWVSGGHIVKGTAKVNDTYFNTTSYNTPAWRQSVLCQEVGHAFGLDHQSESGADLDTCMDYSRSPNIHPDQHDYNQLALIYQHGDSSNGGSISPGASNGRGLKRVREGLYVENLGGDRKRFVWVFWKNRGRAHYELPAQAG
jgi:hypothetical protein